MSRSRLTALAALALVLLSVGVYVARRATGGTDVSGPRGDSAWEVTLTATGQIADAKHGGVVTSAVPDFRRQHVYDESWQSDELVRREGRADAGRPAPTREVIWKRRAMGAGAGPYRVTYTFRCVLGIHRPTPAMRERTRDLDAAPRPEGDPTLLAEPRVESDSREVADLARELAGDRTASADQVRAFYDHVAALPHRESEGANGALDCLRAGGGDDVGKSRLLVALCRSRKVPARVVTGIVLNPNAPPAVHHWAEAFLRSEDAPEGHWLPADPTYEHFGARRWPGNYLVVRLDDDPLVKGPGTPRVGLFARPLADRPPSGEDTMHAVWRTVSLAGLPPPEQQLVRFLLLLPLAALVVSVFRVLIGVPTYGVFSPALLGLIFRDLHALPWGLGIFVGTVIVGWLIRRALDRFHLLLIPRTAVLLSMIVTFLLVVVVAAARYGVGVTNYIALFPLIILTHMVERFWTVEAEDGTRSSFRTLLGTVVIATAVALCVGPEPVGRWMFRHPETLGVVIAALLLLGRYTGYRISELYRFRDVVEFRDAAVVSATVPAPSANGTAEPVAAVPGREGGA